VPQPGWIGARRRVGSLSEGRSSRRPPLRIGSNRLSINIRLDQLSRMHCANSNCSISCSREFDQIVVGDRVDNQERHHVQEKKTGISGLAWSLQRRWQSPDSLLLPPAARSLAEDRLQRTSPREGLRGAALYASLRRSNPRSCTQVVRHRSLRQSSKAAAHRNQLNRQHCSWAMVNPRSRRSNASETSKPVQVRTGDSNRQPGARKRPSATGARTWPFGSRAVKLRVSIFFPNYLRQRTLRSAFSPLASPLVLQITAF